MNLTKNVRSIKQKSHNAEGKISLTIRLVDTTISTGKENNVFVKLIRLQIN
jgi:hypothetical protein